VRANETAADWLVLTNSSMTSLASSSIVTIGCGMAGGEVRGIAEAGAQWGRAGKDISRYLGRKRDRLSILGNGISGDGYSCV